MPIPKHRPTVTIPVEVRYAETDAMGVVHHAAYLVWCELARTALCRQSGYHYAEIERLGYFLVVTAVELHYRQGTRYGDTAEVTCWLERMSSRGLRFAYEIRRGSTLLVDGATEHVWVERATGKPCRTPEVLREPFARLATDEEQSTP